MVYVDGGTSPCGAAGADEGFGVTAGPSQAVGAGLITPADAPASAAFLGALASETYPALAHQGVASSAYPWSTVVRLEAVFPNGVVTSGSGVMVGRNDVITAGHVVYSPAWGGMATSIIATPAYVPELGYESPYGSSYAFVTAADTRFDPDGDRLIARGDRGPGLAGSELDFAFLSLQYPLGDRTSWMGLDPGRKEGYANLSGYPNTAGYRLTNDTAWAFDDPVDAVTNIHHFEAHPGHSGGPVWYYGADGRPTVIALVSSGRDGRGGVAFDIATSYVSILDWIASNDHLIA